MTDESDARGGRGAHSETPEAPHDTPWALLDAVDSLVAQVSRPVRWDLCMDTMKGLGVTGLIELAPAGALAGLAKRGLSGVKTVAVKTPADLTAALELFAEDAEQNSTTQEETA